MFNPAADRNGSGSSPAARNLAQTSRESPPVAVGIECNGEVLGVRMGNQ